VLTADSSTATGLKWSAPASGGMTLISTTTLTGSSVTLSSIPTDYKNLQLVIRNYRPATDNTLRLRMNSDSNANRHVDIGNQTNEPFISTFFEFGNNTDGDAASQSLHIADIIDYANTTTWKLVFVISINNNNSTNTNAGGNFTLKAYNQIPAITSLVLFPASGNFTSGTALLYGVK
jgi:hypothetical protein